jgi:uncharacterized protein (TIGR00645 family)
MGGFLFARRVGRLDVLPRSQHAAAPCPTSAPNAAQSAAHADLLLALAAVAAVPRPDRRAGRVRVLFVKELLHLIAETPHLGEQEIMLIVLGLIDVVMISNLLVMVIVGGYETFVSRLRLEGHPDQPEWLSHVNASVLKVKLAMAIIGISSIHLLKSFIEVGMVGGLPLCSSPEGIGGASARCAAPELKACTTITQAGVLWQTVIHSVFIISALGIAWTDKLMTGAASKREHVHAH